MGTNICKTTSHENQPNPGQSTACNNIISCCPASQHKFIIKKDQQISPIQFSDAESFKNTPNKQKEKVAGIGIVGSEGKEQGDSNVQLINKIGHHEPEQCFNKKQQNKYLAATALTKSKIQPNTANSQMKIHLKQIQFNMKQQITVPNSVIKLIIKPQILKQGKKTYRNFQQLIYSNENKQNKIIWKLHPKGFYICRLQDQSIVVITENQLFKGRVNRNSFKAQGEGLLISNAGFYKGLFQDGFAHGKGQYFPIKGKRKFQGEWRCGQLQKGRIQTQNYIYQGCLKNSVPHGIGSLNLRKKSISYKGPFINGQYQGPNGKYQCQQYIYQGEFKSGKKNGKGKIKIKQRSATKQNPNIKFKAQKVLQGVFQNDVLHVNGQRNSQIGRK